MNIRCGLALLMALAINGCSETPERVQDRFRAKLYAQSDRWNSLEWERCDPRYGLFTFRATYVYDGKSVFFHALNLGNAIHITAYSNKPEGDANGDIIASWCLPPDADFWRYRPEDRTGKRLNASLDKYPELNRPAEDLARLAKNILPLK